MDREDRAPDRDRAVAYLEGLSRFGIRLGLERMAFLLDALGHPERRLRVVHVAGTNGKGSTCAMLAAVLQAAGYRTGLYTSPHLVRYEERIRLNGAPIPGERLAALVARLREIVAEAVRAGLEHPTEFEVGTAAMYAYFAEAGAEVVVQETGLGGRFDATNLVAAPLVSVITPIGLDHWQYLGSDLQSIAAEKAGIIKFGCPVVVGPQPERARRVIGERASACGAPVIAVGQDVSCRIKDLSQAGAIIDYSGSRWRLRDLHLGLPGRYQVANAACALAALEVIDGGEMPVPERAVRTGLSTVRWPGRLESFLARGEIRVILDVAHNPQAASALREGLQELFPGRLCAFVLGLFSDKDVRGFLAKLAPVASCLVTTSTPGARMLPADHLLGIAKEMQEGGIIPKHVNLRACPTLDEALIAGAEAVGPQGLLCVTGSFSVVGPARRQLLPD